MSHCFFCTRRNDVHDEDYGIPLCITCRHLDHFQILLLEQLAFLHATLTEIQEVLDPTRVTYSLAPEEDDDAS